MTTYTTPHFATGVPDRSNVRPDPALNRARTASAAPYRTAGVTNEAALMSDGQTPDWQPGTTKGVPKAAIGALGAALVGGVALAIVLMAPSNKVTRQALPDPIAQAAANNTATAKSADRSTDAAVSEMDKQAPAAGNPAAATTSTSAPAAGAEPVIPAPVQAVIPDAPPVATAPVAHVNKARSAPVATPRATPQPVRSAPTASPDATLPPQVTPPADVQPPAMQQTPDTTTVAPSTPAPTPTPTPDTPAPTPAPVQ